MPPRNPPRSLLSEEGLAERLAYERERRGWTYDSLAKRMTDAGCPINQSAIYKIEKGRPRRRITVDELVALSQVLDMPIEHLLLPPELAATQRLGELLREWEEASDAATQADIRLHKSWTRLTDYVSANAAITGNLSELLHSWAERRFGPEQRDEMANYWLAKISREPLSQIQRPEFGRG